MVAKRPKSANQLRLFAKAVERKSVQTYMAKADEYDIENRFFAEKILEHPEKVTMPFYLTWATLVIERLNAGKTAKRGDGWTA